MKSKYIITGFGFRKNLYWNGCGWTEFRKTANVYSKADAEQIIDKMMQDRIMGDAIPV